MDRRNMLGLLGAGAVGLAALSDGEAKGQEPSKKLDPAHKECREACTECTVACDMATNHCLMLVAEGKREHAKPLRFVVDCSGFCGLAAANVAKHSPLMAHSCEACGEACKETLAVVSTFDSVEMKAVAKSLDRCVKACEAMVAAMGHHHH